MASYAVNDACVERARSLIRARQYVLESDWGEAQPDAERENAYLASHAWEAYAAWHLGLQQVLPTRRKRGTPSSSATSAASTARH